jgi:tetratricopeptide (TPR) repeat protein
MTPYLADLRRNLNSRTPTPAMILSLLSALIVVCSLLTPNAADAQVQQLHALCGNPTATSDERISACSQLIQSGWDSDRNLAVSYFNRGAAQEKKGDLDRAIADFNQALQIQPSYAKAYNGRGIAYLRQCASDQALLDFNRAIELNPAFIQAYNNRAATLLSKGQADRAVADATAAIQIDSGYAFAYATRAASNTKLRELSLAAADIDRALSIDPKLPAAYNARGSLHGVKNELDLAIADFDQVLQFDPTFAGAYENRGFAFSQKGDLASAITDYTRAIDLRPRCAGSYIKRARAYLLASDLKHALSDANTAATLASASIAALTVRSQIYVKLEDFPAALRDVNEAIRLDPNNHEVSSARDLLNERMSQRDQVVSAEHSSTHTTQPASAASNPALNSQSNASQSSASAPVARPAQASATPQTTSVPGRSLSDALAACDRQAQNSGPFILPGSKGDITLDQSYRGPDHLTCVATALSMEARAINQDYKDITASKYQDVNNVDAICKIDSATIAEQSRRAKGFDARWQLLKSEYAKVADSSSKVEEALGQVVLPDMARGGDIVQSMTHKIEGAIKKLSESQSEIAALSHDIEDSRKALATFPVIRASMCPRGAS